MTQKILIGNLPADVTVEEITKVLTEAGVEKVNITLNNEGDASKVAAVLALDDVDRATVDRIAQEDQRHALPGAHADRLRPAVHLTSAAPVRGREAMQITAGSDTRPMLDTLQRLARWMRPAAPMLALAGLALLLLCIGLLLLTEAPRTDHLLLPAIAGLVWCLCGYVFILTFQHVPAFPRRRCARLATPEATVRTRLALVAGAYFHRHHHRCLDAHQEHHR